MDNAILKEQLSELKYKKEQSDRERIATFEEKQKREYDEYVKGVNREFYGYGQAISDIGELLKEKEDE